MEQAIYRSLNRLNSLRTTRRSLLLAAGGLLLTACGEGVSGDQSRQAPDLSVDYPHEDVFVAPDWLRDRIGDPDLRLLDLAELPEYRSGHIPGAQHIWWQDTIEVHNPVYGMMVNNAGRAELVRESGITSGSTVVCYDDAGGVHAARFIWMLRYMGFHDARLLNGGKAGWVAAGGELTRDEPDPPEGELQDIFDESTNATAADISARLAEPGLVILDTRTESERDQTWRGLLREGAIPGSVWLPRDHFFQDDRVPILVDADTLRSELAEAGVDLDATAEFIVYGLHGTLAALPALALVALERFQVRVYDGSWAEWGGRDDLDIVPLNS